jgi:hypothetical protein
MYITPLVIGQDNIIMAFFADEDKAPFIPFMPVIQKKLAGCT